jgi:hypothetical protein
LILSNARKKNKRPKIGYKLIIVEVGDGMMGFNYILFSVLLCRSCYLKLGKKINKTRLKEPIFYNNYQVINNLLSQE